MLLSCPFAFHANSPAVKWWVQRPVGSRMLPLSGWPRGLPRISPVYTLSTGLSPCPSACEASPECCPVGSSAQNGSALKREFSGGSYNAKWQPMPSPSEGSLSSGGMDQGSDTPARDFDGEVSGVWAAVMSHLEKSCVKRIRTLTKVMPPPREWPQLQPGVGTQGPAQPGARLGVLTWLVSWVAHCSFAQMF